MQDKIVPDFAVPVNRESTDAAKFASRKCVFNNDSLQPLWVADMDLAVPPFLQEALTRRITHPCYGYTVQSTQLNKTVQWWMKKEHSLAVGLSSILLSPSVVTSISNTIAAFTNTGDGVALFSPVYERFYSVIQHNHRTLVNIPLLLDQRRYYIDFTSFQEACQSGRIKLLIFCNPQNPSGRVWSREELTRLVQICNENNVLLFSDEIHSDIVFPPNNHTSIQTIEGAEQQTIVAHSIGKTFNTSGLQGSFVIIPNSDQQRIFRAQSQKTHTADINLLAKTAMETLLTVQGQAYKKQLIDYLKTNRDTLEKYISPLKGLSLMPPESTFLAWIDFRQTGLSHDKVKKMLIFDAGLGLSDGLIYGSAGEGWFRLNFAVARTELVRAIKKLKITFK
jgi:cystathionine beta-lyase